MPLPSPVLIIDAYNVLHAAPKVQGDLAGLTLAGLAKLIEDSRFQSAAVLVCDGSGGRTAIDDRFMHPDAPVRVVFAGPGKDADSAIERMVMEEERKGQAGSVVVVSSDKGVLASAIGPFGAKAGRMTSERFVRALLEDSARRDRSRGTGVEPERPKLDADSARRWMKEFGIEPSSDSGPRDAGGPSAEPSESRDKLSGAAHAEHGSTQKQDWPEGIDPDDLDMGKWLKE